VSRISKESGRLKEKIVWGRSTYAPIDEEDLPACMFLGMSFERLLIDMYPWLIRIGELNLDGIAMSPDAVSFDCKRHILSPHTALPAVLHEFKCTWKSSRTPLEERVNYLQQMKSYCKALGTNYGVLWVFNVMGDYKFGDSDQSGPRLFTHHIEFSDWEIESSWSEILRKKKEYEL
jgi:hypothetical protein